MCVWHMFVFMSQNSNDDNNYTRHLISKRMVWKLKKPQHSAGVWVEKTVLVSTDNYTHLITNIQFNLTNNA